MSAIAGVKKSFQDTLVPEIKVELSGVKEGIQLIRSDMTSMERRLEQKIQAARTEILLRMELSEKAVQLAEKAVQLVEKDRLIEELKRERTH